MDIFVSVGTGLNHQQERFVSSVEARLKAIGFTPLTIGRNTFSTDAPLRAVMELMDRCAGTVVIALERYFFENGKERRGSEREAPLPTVSLPTAWNQIEAALAYGRNLPLLVLVDEELRCDGLLEKGNDWFVLDVRIDADALEEPQFVGLLNDWRNKVVRRHEQRSVTAPPDAEKPDVQKMSVAQLIGALKPGQLWSAVVAIAGTVAGAFALGLKLGG